MATLIQSKQIEGVVTASVIVGEFEVSGSSQFTGSLSITGDVTASGAFIGDGSKLSFGGTNIVSGSSQLTFSELGGLPAGLISGSSQVDYTSLTNVPTFLPGENTTITSGSNIITISSTGGGANDSLNSFTASYFGDSASFDSRIDGISASGSGADFNVNLSNIPSGLVSGSSQVVFTSLSSIPSGIISSSEQLPAGVVSGSIQVLGGTDIISGSQQITALGFISSSHTDITSLNSYTASNDIKISNLESTTSSLDTRITQLSNATGSYETVGRGIISSSEQLPSGVLSGSEQITSLGFISESSVNTSLNTFTSSIQTEVDGLSAATSSYLTSSGSVDYSDLTSVPSGIVSGSEQITSLGFISESSVNTSLNEFTASATIQLSNLESTTSSLDTRITTEKTRIDNILSGADANYDQFVEIVDLVNSTDTENDTAFANHYTSSRQRDLALEQFSSSIQTEVDALSAATSSYLTSLDGGIISSSEQLPGGIVSGSSQLTGLGFLSGSLLPGTNITINSGSDGFFISSSAGGGSSVTVSDSAPGSPSEGDLWWKSNDGNLYVYYDGYWVISIDTTNALPTGVLSGSAQITALGFVSSSGDSTPAGTISGSQQITDLGFISSSDSTTSLNTFTSSIQTEVDGLSAATSSYLTEVPAGTISGSSQLTSSYDARYALSGSGGAIPSGTVSGSSQLTSSYDDRYQLSGSSIPFDGNRIVSQEKLPTMFTSSFNPGTSGSVVDFLNAIFYPNSDPSITSGNQTISEYSASSAAIFTLEATDPEGQTITFGTASDYTDDLVRVASNGVVTLNALAESSSFNTDLVGGSHGHTFTATATDTFNSTVEKDITIFVTPNAAPIFRETSVAGNQITNVTASLNESSTNGTLVKRIFFTDAESDTITIDSSSISPQAHFTITKSATYVDITQNTGSLNYEVDPLYTFSISASDEHFQNSQDSDSISVLPVSISIVDNATPTVNNQSLSAINENSSNGTVVGSISANDTEGDTITFVNFNLYKLELDNANVSSGSYGGTSQLTDPHENPFQMNSSGQVTRKTGVFINSDLINEYQYTVEVRDSYNNNSNPAIITIPITDDTPATLTDNFTNLFIKESEVSGSTIKTTNYGSTTADFDSNQAGTFSSSNPAIAINSSGNLSMNVDLSGSVTQSGETIDSTITFTNGFSTTTTQAISVTVVPNSHPSASFTLQNSNLNTNLATTNTNLVSVSITDTESDTPFSASLSGTDAAKLNINYTNSNSSSLFIRANENLSAGTITYNLRVTDAYSEVSDYTGQTIPINKVDTGTLGGDTTSHLIESARSGSVLRDASGFEAGNASQLTVSYSGSDGTPSVQSFTSSNAAIDIDNSGNLTLAVDISGSATSSGDTISSDITFQDNYGNLGSGSLTVNVFANSHPSASFTNNSGVYNTNQATSSALMVSLTITDEETDTPFSMSLSGTDASKFNIVPQNSNTSSVQLTAASDFDGGTYSYTASIFDQFGETSQYEREITIAQATLGTLSTNGTFYVIESATNTVPIKTNSDGRTGTNADLGVSYSPNYGSQVVQSFTSSNAFIAVNSSGALTVGNPISGSGNVSGDTLNSNITWADQHGNIGSGSISVNITTNNAPTTSSISTQFENTNQATGSSQLLSLTISDVESDSIPDSALSWSIYNDTYFVPNISSPYMRLLVNNTSVPSGTYPWEVHLQDVHGFSTRVVSGSLVIAQADTGTMSGDTAIYAIESALSGSVLRDATGFGNGNASDVDVSYSPAYGSPVVQSFTSSNAAIAISDSGAMTLAVDLSGSATQSGDTVSTTITFDDQYGNVGSGSVTLNVFGNSSPVAAFTSSSNYESDNATSGSDAGALVVTDVESNSPFTVTLAGTDGGKFDVSGSTSPFEIQPTGSLAAGTYSINITVTDSYSESVTLSNQSIVVDQSANNGKVYIYYSNYASDGNYTSAYNSVMGASTLNSDTPPEVTAYTANTASPYYKIKTSVGDSSYALAGGKTMTLAATISGSDFPTILSASAGAMSWGTTVQTVIVIPSGSSMTNVPTSMTDGFGGSTVGEYALVHYADGTSAPLGASPSMIHTLDVDGTQGGFDKWHVLGAKINSSATNMRIKVVPSSGSLGNF